MNVWNKLIKRKKRIVYDFNGNLIETREQDLNGDCRIWNCRTYFYQGSWIILGRYSFPQSVSIIFQTYFSRIGYLDKKNSCGIWSHNLQLLWSRGHLKAVDFETFAIIAFSYASPEVFTRAQNWQYCRSCIFDVPFFICNRWC